MKTSVRQIMNTDPVTILKGGRGIWSVTYEDGVTLDQKQQEVVLNRFCWELTRDYPDFKITSDLTVSSVIGEGGLNANTHIRFLEKIFKKLCMQYGLNSYSSKEHLVKKTFQIYNWIYNDLICNIGSSVTGIDAEDFSDIHRSPEITALRESMEPTPVSVGKTYQGIKKFMKSDTSKNSFNRAYRAQAINDNQANQCIGPRGFVTDVDRTVFTEPVRDGFIYGLHSLYELIVESLTATKAFNASSVNIEQSEYASRRVQLLSMVVDEAINGDCGSTDYVEMAVTKKRLANMSGIYYLDETDNQLKWIDGSEEHLIGKPLKIRTPLGCKLHNPSKVCTTCLGKISENFKENSNLGYTLTAYMMEKISQSMLSRKHLTESVGKSSTKLDKQTATYFRMNNDDDSFYFNRDVKLDDLTIVLPYKQVAQLVAVLNTTSSNIGMNRIGELDTIAIYYGDDDSKKLELNITVGECMSLITKEFLEHIRSVNMSSDSKSNFLIPMKGFDKSKPVFENLLKEKDLLKFVHTVAGVIEKVSSEEGNVKFPEDKLITLFDTMIADNTCNLTACGVIVYSTTVYNPEEDNLNLGRNAVMKLSGRASDIFKRRSVSQFLAYEAQAKIMDRDISMFDDSPRQPHPLDAIFAPREVMRSIGK